MSFVYLQGGFAFEKGPTHSVTVKTGLGDIGRAAGLVPGVNDLIDDVLDYGGMSISDDFSTLNGTRSL